ncbi:hypothetical protein [Bombilactobacillus thymidiniphilus]|uniref:DUF2922 family protein n=1 Tax=Bombilactobacillus thymidiniphilus TaxID=2923363 RepID=A0ABY4PDU8_9LACO|nr:hypothetical protein [Bombilactobacillus thymidiniphilus]UQS83442.1 hypothetical protein MOO47_06625 [Bombilactobacillus thymidiniphilus]
MKKKTFKSILKQNKAPQKLIYAQVSFSDGSTLRINVASDDQTAIARLKRQLRDKDGIFTDNNGRQFDLKKLVSYRFVD